MFKPKEELPGKMVNAFRKMFQWQKIQLAHPNAKPAPIAEFSGLVRVCPKTLVCRWKYRQLLRGVCLWQLSKLLIIVRK